MFTDDKIESCYAYLKLKGHTVPSWKVLWLADYFSLWSYATTVTGLPLPYCDDSDTREIPELSTDLFLDFSKVDFLCLDKAYWMIDQADSGLDYIPVGKKYNSIEEFFKGHPFGEDMIELANEYAFSRKSMDELLGRLAEG